MTAPITRPPRTDGHRQRDALLQRFADAGLVPVISTNGGIPNADIQLSKALLSDGGKHGEVIEARLTERGEQRLAEAERPRYYVGSDVTLNVSDRPR